MAGERSAGVSPAGARASRSRRRRDAAALRSTPFALAVFALLLGAASSATAEVCRFRAAAADDPFKRWLSSQEVTCAQSGSPLTFPSGLWNVFVRTASSISLDPILVDGASPPPAIDPALGPAATLIVHLPPGRAGVIYAAGRGTAIPAAGRNVVPAHQELWLLIVEQSDLSVGAPAPGRAALPRAAAPTPLPVGVMTIPPLEEGGEREIDARNSSTPAVLGWLNLSNEDLFAVARAQGVSSPGIRFKDREARPLPPPERLHGAFFLIPGPFAADPVGARSSAPGTPGYGAADGELQLAGRGWLSHRRKIAIAPRPLTLVREPLVARTSASVTVDWTADRGLTAAAGALASCDRRPAAEVVERRMLLSLCSSPTDQRTCQVIRDEQLDAEAGRGKFTYGEVPPGSYRAELRIGTLAPFVASGIVERLKQRTLEVKAGLISAFGHLTHGGQPLGVDAKITFGAGEFGFAEGTEGPYNALLLKRLRQDQKIDIVTCKGAKFFVITDEAMVPGRAYDLEIPDTRLTVSVVDTFTRLPLSDATIRAVIMSRHMPRSPVATLPVPYVLEGVPLREIRLEVGRAGYKTQQLAPFTISKHETKEIEVQLVPLDGTEGRIVSEREFERGTIVWATPGGVETERAELFSDGSFFFQRSHLRGESMTVVSASHPLWTVAAPPPSRRSMPELRFPDTAALRGAQLFVTGVSEREATLIGVEIGGFRVPGGALVLHMRLRGGKPVVLGEGHETISDLADTAPMRVLRSAPFPLRLTPTTFIDAVVRDFEPIDARPLTPGIDGVITFEGPPS